MAQKSKKEHIIQTALPLFLENGFKGTSIDMVVKASEVSKPTVYNHFPDKAALMLAVLTRWIDDNKPVITPLHEAGAFQRLVRSRWLRPEAVGLYALVIGEGWRFPEAKRLFWEQFDERWRKALTYAADHAAIDAIPRVDLYLDQQLLQSLRSQ